MENNQPAGAGAMDAAIAEVAQTAATPEAEAPQEVAQEQKPEVDHTQEELKKLRNALDRKNREMGKKTAQKHQLQQELETYKQKLAQYETKNPNATFPPQPTLEQFGSDYEAYKRAHNEWVETALDRKVEQKLAKEQQEAREKQTVAEKQAWKEEREEYLRENAAKARETIPNFQAVLTDNQHILAEFPPHVVDAFLDSDNPAYAFHQMIEDGSIDLLLQAPNERRAAALIAKAEVAALTPKPKPVTAAPAPLQAAKGSAPSSKSPETMTGKEILKWLKS